MCNHRHHPCFLNAHATCTSQETSGGSCSPCIGEGGSYLPALGMHSSAGSISFTGSALSADCSTSGEDWSHADDDAAAVLAAACEPCMPAASESAGETKATENAACGGAAARPSPASCTVLGVHMPPSGWFAKCRGCGWMTAREPSIMGMSVPLCGRWARVWESNPLGPSWARMRPHSPLLPSRGPNRGAEAPH
jgi:hypothetical protein